MTWVWYLTCRYCKHAEATHLLVYDLPTALSGDSGCGSGRVTSLVCETCGSTNLRFARQIAVSPASAWLFRLEPAEETSSEDGTAATAREGAGDGRGR